MQSDAIISCQCSICKKGQYYLTSTPKMKTTKLCVLILKALKEIYPDKEFFSLKDDIFVFIHSHWCYLSALKQFQAVNYKKAILDAFNHCTSIQSGKGICKTRGYYKLKEDYNDGMNLNKTEIKQELISSFTELQNFMYKNVDRLCHLNKKLTLFCPSDYLKIVNSQITSINSMEMFKRNLIGFQ